MHYVYTNCILDQKWGISAMWYNHNIATGSDLLAYMHYLVSPLECQCTSWRNAQNHSELWWKLLSLKLHIWLETWLQCIVLAWGCDLCILVSELHAWLCVCSCRSHQDYISSQISCIKKQLTSSGLSVAPVRFWSSIMVLKRLRLTYSDVTLHRGTINLMNRASMGLVWLLCWPCSLSASLHLAHSRSSPSLLRLTTNLTIKPSLSVV